MFRFLFPVPGLCLLAAMSLQAGTWPSSTTAATQAERALSKAPAWFERAAEWNGFVSHNGLGTLSVGQNEATYSTSGGSVRMRLLRANPIAAMEGQKALASQSNY